MNYVNTLATNAQMKNIDLSFLIFCVSWQYCFLCVAFGRFADDEV